MERQELHTLLLGMFHLLQAGRHLLLASTIDNHGTVSTQPTSRTHGIHCGVSSTDHSHTLAFQHGRIALGIGRIHQVHTG